MREVTALEGVEHFALSPDQRKLLVHYSSSYMPVQLATVPVSGGAATKLTDTRTRRIQGAPVDRAAVRGGAVDQRRRPGLGQAVPPGARWNRARNTRS